LGGTPNNLTLPPVLPKSSTGVNNIHGMPLPQSQNTVAPETAHTSPPTNQVTMISTNSPVPPLGQTAPPSIQGQFGNLPMVGGVPGLPPPNMPGQLGNIPTIVFPYDPDTCCSGIFVPLTVGFFQLVHGYLVGVRMIHQSWACSHSGSQLYNQMFQVPPPPLLGFSTPQFVQGPSGDLIQRCTSRLLPSSNCGRRRACYYICPYSRRKFLIHYI
jgi:hypothetical protein